MDLLAGGAYSSTCMIDILAHLAILGRNICLQSANPIGRVESSCCKDEARF